ncbi:peptidylprolyl isomerase [Thiolapillus brandeum]|uniref:Chaperone SurA n=1 Tax=Thiolapillus brandeum TaxID=1076588 RepID=A0A7U6GKY8_9GAMM|nr:peptidylprolyl isomerase [Thiolapillus brandeum]BAO45555.1 peptidyl-prolyl cis-trans isomerase SurA [Thiolapillus brandeum]
MVIDNSSRQLRLWLLLLLAASLLLPATLTFAAEAELLDRIVAVVNDDVVLQSELDQEVASVKEKLAQVGAEDIPRDEIRKQALERLILEKLQLAEARKIGATVDDETLLMAMNKIAQQNGLSLDELAAALKEQGMSMDDYREELRKEITLQRLRNREVISSIQITKAEVDNYLAHAEENPGGRDAYHLRHILVPTPEGASPEEVAAAKKQAREIIQRLNNGEDFASLATRYSAGQQALEGGDLGWLQAGQVPTLFIKDLAGMERGDINGPYQAASGFHIIKLEDYKGGDKNIIKQTHARHILIRTDELTSDQDARNRLEQLYQRIKGGEDFAALARAHSDDKGSAIKGGDLGWVNPGDLVPKFEETMDALPINGLSEPFRTQFGWHIVQVLGRRNHDATEEVKRDKAKLALRKRKADEALQLYLRKLRGQAFVETRLDDKY